MNLRNKIRDRWSLNETKNSNVVPHGTRKKLTPKDAEEVEKYNTASDEQGAWGGNGSKNFKRCTKCGQHYTTKVGKGRKGRPICDDCKDDVVTASKEAAKKIKEKRKEPEGPKPAGPPKPAEKDVSLCQSSGCEEKRMTKEGRGRKPIYCEKHHKEKLAKKEASKGNPRGRKAGAKITAKEKEQLMKDTNRILAGQKSRPEAERETQTEIYYKLLEILRKKKGLV